MCAGSTEQCDVKLSDGTVRLELTGVECRDPAAKCSVAPKAVTCTIPALDAGSYQLFFTHGSNLDQIDLLVSDGNAGVTSCGLTPAQAMDPTGYDQSCVNDWDCVNVASGDPCTMCHCPNAAIAQSAASQYQRDWQRQAAECTTAPVNVCDCAAIGQPKCVSNKCTFGLPGM
jgi:hypothetical protein